MTSFLSSLPSLLCLMPWLRLPLLWWIGVVKMRAFVLFLILEKSFQPFTTEYDVAMGLSYMTFTTLTYIAPIPNLLKVFIKGYCILSNVFSVFRQPYDSYLSLLYHCDVPHIFMCVCWSTLVSWVWILFSHGIWSF